MLSQKRRRLDEAGNFKVDCISYCYKYCTSNCHRRLNNTCSDNIQRSTDKVGKMLEQTEEISKKTESNELVTLLDNYINKGEQFQLVL
jgi:hypothetical protein